MKPLLTHLEERSDLLLVVTKFLLCKDGIDVGLPNEVKSKVKIHSRKSEVEVDRGELSELGLGSREESDREQRGARNPTHSIPVIAT